jgi:hypothetical protein
LLLWLLLLNVSGQLKELALIQARQMPDTGSTRVGAGMSAIAM